MVCETEFQVSLVKQDLPGECSFEHHAYEGHYSTAVRSFLTESRGQKVDYVLTAWYISSSSARLISSCVQIYGGRSRSRSRSADESGLLVAIIHHVPQ
jgi:hypothetical protein